MHSRATCSSTASLTTTSGNLNAQAVKQKIDGIWDELKILD